LPHLLPLLYRIAATHPEETLGVILIGGLHLSNFFQTTDRVTRVLESANAMLTSPTQFATRDAALDYIRASRRNDTEESVGDTVRRNRPHC